VTENDLRDQALSRLSDDFQVAIEAEGVNIVEGTRLRIDLLCYPMPHLIDAGFAPALVGVEFKIIDQRKGAQKGLNKMMWQALTYGQSRFSFGGEMLRPMFVAVCFNRDDLIEPQVYSTLASFCQYANVGYLFWSDRHKWSLRGYGSTYFQRNMDGALYRSNIENVLVNRRVGNVS